MDWRSHAIIGAVLAAVVLYFLHANLITISILSIFAAFSALLPDIDHSMSKIRVITDRAIVIFALLYGYNSCNPSCQTLEFLKTALLLIGIYFLAITFLKPRHRGITHSLLFTVLYGAFLYAFFDLNLAIAGVIGYGSHLLADRQIKLI